MSRAADYTIKGFLYQFNKTLLEILASSDGSEVTVEGIIEDIDITGPGGTHAIQCKYHEAQESFSLSLIYKPLLQMMSHFHSSGGVGISYRLFAHFPSEPPGIRNLSAADLEKALCSKNRDLVPLAAPLRGKINYSQFLDKFTCEFGPSFDALCGSAQQAFEREGLPKDDIEYLFYPNALHIIGTAASSHSHADRTITKASLISRLATIRSTTLSRWTLALATRSKLLASRRKQLRSSLSVNSRKRYFLISSKSIHGFDDDIVQFIKSYLEKYHFKPAHIETPLFCLDCSEQTFEDIHHRLDDKGIPICDGFKLKRFYLDHLHRSPLMPASRQQAALLPHTGPHVPEFRVRLCRYDGDLSVLTYRKCDDLFVVSGVQLPETAFPDACVERIDIATFQELSYVLGISHAL